MEPVLQVALDFVELSRALKAARKAVAAGRPGADQGDDAQGCADGPGGRGAAAGIE